MLGSSLLCLHWAACRSSIQGRMLQLLSGCHQNNGFFATQLGSMVSIVGVSSAPPPPPPPPLPPPGMLKGCPVPLNQQGLGSSPGGPPPLQAEDTSPSAAMVWVGSVMVCVAMTVVLRGSLEVAVLLLGQVRRGIDSASFSSCLSNFSSSLEGILISILSGCPLLLLSSTSLWSDFSPLIGPQSLRSTMW